MHHQPRRAERRRFILPDTDKIGADITEKAGQFSNADAIGGGLQLDERIVTAKGNSCAFQRLIHEKRTCCFSSACESYEMVACQSLHALRHPVLGKVTGRCIKRVADLAKLATDQPGTAWTSYSDRKIGFATGDVQRADADGQVDAEIGMAFAEFGNGRRDHPVGQCFGRGQPYGAGRQRIASRGDALEIQRGIFHRGALTQDGVSRCSHSKAVRRPMQQSDAQALFKKSNPPPYGHMADAQHASGSRQATGTRDGKKVAHIIPLPGAGGSVHLWTAYVNNRALKMGSDASMSCHSNKHGSRTVTPQIPGYLLSFESIVRPVITIIALSLIWLGAARQPASAKSRYATAGALSAVLIGWLAVAQYLGAAATSGTTLPIVLSGLVIPPTVAAIGLWRSESIARLVSAIPLHWLVAAQVYRVAGGIVLVLWAEGRMPWQFALPAGIGDVATASAAVAVAALLARNAPGAHSATYAWCLFGIADIVVATIMGAMTSPAAAHLLALEAPNVLIASYPLVMHPFYGVPLGLMLHGLVLWRLRRGAAATGRLAAA